MSKGKSERELKELERISRRIRLSSVDDLHEEAGNLDESIKDLKSLFEDLRKEDSAVKSAISNEKERLRKKTLTFDDFKEKIEPKKTKKESSFQDFFNEEEIIQKVVTKAKYVPKEDTSRNLSRLKSKKVRNLWKK